MLYEGYIGLRGADLNTGSFLGSVYLSLDDELDDDDLRLVGHTNQRGETIDSIYSCFHVLTLLTYIC